jgi:hypothetical protein
VKVWALLDAEMSAVFLLKNRGMLIKNSLEGVRGDGDTFCIVATNRMG